MNCPSCKDVTLVMTERQGVEIDYCPQCRGVWLDRGELDKIIERSEREFAASQARRGVLTPPGARSAGPASGHRAEAIASSSLSRAQARTALS